MASQDRNSRSIELPLDQYPGINPHSLKLIQEDPLSIEKLASAPPIVPPSPLVEQIAEYNLKHDNDVSELISRWRKGARPIVAGQQAGFAGGPGYTLAKLASIIRLSELVNQAGGQTVPVFWIATEDHDYSEVARADIRFRRTLHKLRSHQRSDGRFPVGTLPVPEDLKQELIEILEINPPAWLHEGITFGDSFARLIGSIAKERVILIDSLEPALRSAGSDLLHRIHADRKAILDTIEENSSRIESEGYTAQVSGRDDDGITLLYAINESGQRERLLESDSLPFDAGRISTAALARPLLQDHVLRPVAFVGGPAEVAYYAQLDGIHALLEIERPATLLRAHILLAPDKELDAAFRRGLTEDELLDDPRAAILRREGKLATDLSSSVKTLETELTDRLAQLRERISDRDSTMTRPFERASANIKRELEKVKRKGSTAIARSDRERFEAFERIHQTLMAGGAAQDRTVNWISYELGYQGSLLDEIMEFAVPHQPVFHIVGIGGRRN